MLFKNLATQKVWEVNNPDRIKELRTSNEYEEIKQEETKVADKKSKTKAQ